MFLFSLGSAQVDLFEASKQGQFLLMVMMVYHCWTGNIIAVDDIILANRQAVHAVDKDGATPLMFAAMRGHVEVCKGMGLVALLFSVYF